jgi:hypothetical protein
VSEAENEVWRWISGLLANPDKVRAGIEAMIYQEREGAYRDPNRESRAWQEKLAEADRVRGGQPLALCGRGHRPHHVVEARGPQGLQIERRWS